MGDALPLPLQNQNRNIELSLRSNSGKEVEVKLRVADREALLRRLARLNAKLVRPRVHEMNTLYDTPDGALARREQMLRIRVERTASRSKSGGGAGRKSEELVTLTYKGPVERPATREQGRRDDKLPSDSGGDSGRDAAGNLEGGRYKVRDEREVRLSDAGAGAHILEAFGLAPRFRYEKYRTTYRMPGRGGVVVELDETPIGTFLELEGSRAAIDRAAGGLGFGPADYIVETYVALFIEKLREKGRAQPRNESRASLNLSDQLSDRDLPGRDLPDMLFPRKMRDGSRKRKR
jgi:adenylate cyclase class IV